MSHDLTVERVFDAAPEVVFDAFTNPDAQKVLYAPAPDWIVESECDTYASAAAGGFRSAPRAVSRLSRRKSSKRSTDRIASSTDPR
jgi:uncharacterized protein YndB with AHSA1/START domain